MNRFRIGKDKTRAVTHYNAAKERETPLPTAVGDPGDHVFDHKVESQNRVAFSESHLVRAPGIDIVSVIRKRCIIESRLE